MSERNQHNVPNVYGAAYSTNEEIEDFQARLLAGTWTRRDVVRLIEINQLLQAEKADREEQLEAVTHERDEWAEKALWRARRARAYRDALQEIAATNWLDGEDRFAGPEDYARAALAYPAEEPDA